MSERDDIVPPEIIRLTGPGTSTVPKPVGPIDPPPIDEGSQPITDGFVDEVPPPTGNLGDTNADGPPAGPSMPPATPPPIKPTVDLVEDVLKAPQPSIPTGPGGDGSTIPPEEVPSETFPDWEKSDDMPMPRPEEQLQVEDPNDAPPGVDPTDPPRESAPYVEDPSPPPMYEQAEGDYIEHQEMSGDPTGPMSEEERARRVAQGLPPAPEPLTLPPSALPGEEELPGYIPRPGEPYVVEDAPKNPLRPKFGGAPLPPYQETNVEPPELPGTAPAAKPSEPLDHM